MHLHEGKEIKKVGLPMRSQMGTHTVAYPLGNRPDYNGTDKLSLTRRDLSDPFHFQTDPFHFFGVV